MSFTFTFGVIDGKNPNPNPNPYSKLIDSFYPAQDIKQQLEKTLLQLKIAKESNVLIHGFDVGVLKNTLEEAITILNVHPMNNGDIVVFDILDGEVFVDCLDAPSFYQYLLNYGYTMWMYGFYNEELDHWLNNGDCK